MFQTAKQDGFDILFSNNNVFEYQKLKNETAGFTFSTQEPHKIIFNIKLYRTQSKQVI